VTDAPMHYDQILPNPGFEITKGNTALVITDPQVDFLSETAVTWEIVGPSVVENNTVANLRSLISDRRMPVLAYSSRRTTTTHRTMRGSLVAHWRR